MANLAYPIEVVGSDASTLSQGQHAGLNTIGGKSSFWDGLDRAFGATEKGLSIWERVSGTRNTGAPQPSKFNWLVPASIAAAGILTVGAIFAKKRRK